MIKACVFDMDGTTVNTLETIAHFANTTLSCFSLPTIESFHYKDFLGDGAKVLVERMLSFVGADMSKFLDVYNMYNKIYDDNFLYLTSPYDGILELLANLKNAGIKTAILSNKPHQTAEKISNALFGNTLIDVCIGGKSGIPLKPDPHALLSIIKGFGLSENEVLYIGDTKVDIATAKNTSVKSVGVLWGFRKKEELTDAKADYIVKEPKEILDIVDGL